MSNTTSKRILYLGRKLEVVDGGSIVSKRNILYLKEFSGNNLTEFYFGDKSILKKIFNIFLRNPWGYSRSTVREIKKLLSDIEFSYIFIDHSLLGGYAKLLRGFNIPIITFFHNVECLYYAEKTKVEGLVNITMLWSAKINERKALKYSQKIICLTDRDSTTLNTIYGRGADLILPITLVDKYTDSLSSNIGEGKFHLFVGSAFFANMEGICWYIENVLEKIDLKLVVVGTGMEILNKKYPNHPKLVVKGFVEQLEPYYKNALFVVNPIHKGSGMKTKTIEALMYGKTILGTTEAFVGVNNVEKENVGWICDTAEQFIQKIHTFKRGRLNTYSRNYYLESFGINAGYKILHEFIIGH